MVRVRAAQAEDAESIAAIELAAWQLAYREILPESYLAAMNEGASATRWRGILQRDRSTTLVAATASRVLGYVSFGASRDGGKDEGEVYAIYVHPGAWGAGVGGALLDASRREAQYAGYTRVVLWVLEANARARRFYESMGFVTDGLRKSEDVGGRTVPQVRYAVKVAPRARPLP